MRACLIALAVLIWPPLARAGLYVDNPQAEPGAAIPPELIVSRLLGLRGAAVAPPPGAKQDEFSPRRVYQRQVEQLEARRKAGALSPADRANLGGCLIRLGRVQDAIGVLRGGADSRHFLVTANLATAQFLNNDLSAAIQTQRYLLSPSMWPTVWAGWSGSQLLWYRECERHFLRLMELRFQEQRAGRGGPLGLDELFPKVRFVAEDGTYKPGELARRYADALPGRSIDMVLQLCVWLPGDLRLFWLLGELLNVGGQVDHAYAVLDSLVAPSRKKLDLKPGQAGWAPSQFKGLEAHHKVLARAQPTMKAFRELDLIAYLLGAAQAVPQPDLAPGAAGPVARTAAAWALVVQLPELKKRAAAPPPLPQGNAPPGEVEGYRVQGPEMAFSWRHLGVSFGFGALAATLLGLQWREWQRRRAARRLAAEAPDAEEPVAAGDERITRPQAPGPS
jgi:hypothetical protein